MESIMTVSEKTCDKISAFYNSGETIIRRFINFKDITDLFYVLIYGGKLTYTEQCGMDILSAKVDNSSIEFKRKHEETFFTYGLMESFLEHIVHRGGMRWTWLR